MDTLNQFNEEEKDSESKEEIFCLIDVDGVF